VDLGIKGRNALVFGGSRGVGRAVAGALAAEGANVAVCARKEWAARRVAAEAAEESGVRVAGYPLDAWDEPSAIALVERVTAEFGEIDMLFGIARRAPRDDPRMLSWGSQLEAGFLRFKAATDTLLPGMRRRRWGRVLWMVPWPMARTGMERHVHSVTSAALPAWLRSVATEVASDNVTLNVLIPAPVRIPVAAGRHEEPRAGFRPAYADEALSVTDVAAVAAFLLSDRARGVCGRTIELDGNSALSSRQRRHDNEP